MADDKIRVEMRLTPEVVRVLDIASKRLGMRRTAFVSMAVSFTVLSLKPLWIVHPGMKLRDLWDESRKILESVL